MHYYTNDHVYYFRHYFTDFIVGLKFRVFNSINHPQEKQGKISCLFEMAKVFIKFDAFHSFDTLTFINHH